MELGGNAPFIVFADADLDEAVAGAVVAKMRNGGAACTAANRFYLAAGVAREFTARLAAAMTSLRMGPGTDPANEVGALISAAERDKVADLVSRAVDQGATVHAGSYRPPGAGAFYPAHSAWRGPGDEITKAEIFGPVAPVITFGPEDDIIDWANDTELGLISYVYTASLDPGLAASEQLETGMVALNRCMASDPAAPFGGVKQSGLGREGSNDGIREFLEPKYIALGI